MYLNTHVYTGPTIFFARLEESKKEYTGSTRGKKNTGSTRG
jgi:hypothetical protein